jgi:hypothetical protein
MKKTGAREQARTERPALNSLYGLHDAVIGIDGPGDKARAVAEARQCNITAPLATPQDVPLLRNDIDLLREDMNAGFASLHKDMDRFADRLVLRFAAFTTVSLGLLFAALRYLP